MVEQADETVVLGRISGLHGVRGWVRVFSYTEPRDEILAHPVWSLRTAAGWRRMPLAEGHAHGKGVIARLEGCTDRDAAAALVGADIAIARSALPVLEEGEYYWADLIGLEVVDLGERALGTVVRLMETGANDVLVLRDAAGEERLIPYVPGPIVHDVDLEARRIRVDWEPDY